MKNRSPFRGFTCWVFLCGQALILLTAACGSGDPEESPENRLSVVLVSIDTLRADHLGCYGYERPTTPHIDRFASDGVLFEQCVNTGGGTLPVHLSMLTSLAPAVHGVFAGNGRALAEGHTTLAEALHDAGYATGAFVDGGYLSGNFGFTQGFDLYFDRNFKGVFGKIESYFDDGGFEELLPRALAWLSRHRKQPFFLFLHTYDTHSAVSRLPYESPPPFLNRFVDPGYSRSFDGCREGRCASELLLWHNQARREAMLGPSELFTSEEMEYTVALYDGAISYIDHQIGLLLAALEDFGVAKRTLVVLTSDHGEEFLEHGLLLHDQNYEEVARVPLILRLPDRSHAGRRVTNLVSTLDLLPSILDATRAPPLPQAMGLSLLPLAASSSAEGFERPVHIASGREKLRTRHWSLVVDRNRPAELYSLTDDPTEQVNRIAEHPDVAAELFEQLLEIRSREITIRDRIGFSDSEPAELAPDELEKLRTLGYAEPDPPSPPS
jgi:arylsulfatase A-like enzyme